MRLIEPTKMTVQRTLLVLHAPRSRLKPDGLRLKDELMRSRLHIQEQIDTARESMIPLFNRMVPRLEFRASDRMYTQGYLENLLQVDPVAKSVRAVACVDCHIRSQIQDPLVDADVPYLVHLDAISSKQGWAPDPDLVCSTIMVPREQLQNAIRDILIDNLFYNSFSFLRNLISATERRRVVALKWPFAEARGFVSRFGQVFDELPYFCFASTIPLSSHGWNKEALTQLNDIWTQFLDDCVLPQFLPHGQPPKLKDRAAAIVSYILRNHPRAGQISQKDLRAATLSLQHGPHIFAMLTRRPNSRLARQRIEALFEGRIKMNQWRFFPLTEKWIKQLRASRPFVTIVYVAVEEMRAGG